MPPLFLVLEGPDGSGTTTHAKRLAERLQKDGHDCLLTREPTEGPVGQLVRKQLATDTTTPLPPDALQLLFTADRAAHVKQTIEPALERGETVVCDRYVLSTLAYGMALGLSGEWLTQLNKNFIQAGRTILLLPSLETCMRRVGKRSRQDILEGRSLQERVHDAYGTIAKTHDVAMIDSSAPIEDTEKQIWNILQAMLGA